ncbi:MAG: sensor histidine kinase [Planctomycetota bacterium]|jgi:signal transduction histidine kinase
MSDGDANSVEFLDAAGLRQNSFSEAEQSALDVVNQKVAAEESLADILGFLFDHTQSIFPCDRLALAFVEEETDRIVSGEVRAHYEPIMLKTGYAEDLAGSSLQRVIGESKIRLIHDLPAYLKQNPDSRSTALIVREGVRSSMTCPLSVNGRNVGVLFRSSRTVGAYGPHSVGLHLALSERLSQAVEKAYRIERLGQAHSAYMEMLGFVTHELKSPVSSIIMDADMLIRGYLGELNDRQAKRIERMMVRGRYLLSLISEYLSLARMEQNELRLSPKANVDVLGELITPAIDVVAPQMEHRGLSLTRDFDLSGGGRIECDPELLRIAIVNLLDNAVKYGRLKGELTVTVRREPDGLSLAVRNEGPGFKPSERFKLFHKFSRLDDPELKRQKGTGVGLYAVWRIVQLHGGRVDARSKPGEWAEFSFDIPQPLPTEPEKQQSSNQSPG